MTAEYMKPLVNAPELHNALTTCIEIQNRGIATVFFNLYAHVGRVDIELHAGGWITSQRATEKLQIQAEERTFSKEDAKEVLVRLEEILQNGFVKQADEAEAAAKEARRQQYLALKDEFEGGTK